MQSLYDFRIEERGREVYNAFYAVAPSPGKCIEDVYIRIGMNSLVGLQRYSNSAAEKSRKVQALHGGHRLLVDRPLDIPADFLC